MEFWGSARADLGRKSDRSRKTGAAVRADWKRAKEKSGKARVQQGGLSSRTGEPKKQQQAQKRVAGGGQDTCE